jgi:hypothetical protein
LGQGKRALQIFGASEVTLSVQRRQASLLRR